MKWTTPNREYNARDAAVEIFRTFLKLKQEGSDLGKVVAGIYYLVRLAGFVVY